MLWLGGCQDVLEDFSGSYAFAGNIHRLAWICRLGDVHMFSQLASSFFEVNANAATNGFR